MTTSSAKNPWLPRKKIRRPSDAQMMPLQFQLFIPSDAAKPQKQDQLVPLISLAGVGIDDPAYVAPSAEVEGMPSADRCKAL
jgi:hypothetical protein